MGEIRGKRLKVSKLAQEKRLIVEADKKMRHEKLEESIKRMELARLRQLELKATHKRRLIRKRHTSTRCLLTQ